VTVGRGGRRLDLALLGGLAVLVAAFPLVATTQLVTLGVFAGFYAIAALGLSLLMGRAGQVSLGQAGFFAVGAYTSAILVVRHGWNAVLAALVAVVVTMLVGLVVGLPLLRLRGHYLALATLGFGIILAVVANEWELTGATSGIYGIPKPVFNGRTYDSAREFFWLVWPLVLVAVFLAANLVRGRVGRALAAVSDSEVAAQTLGIDTFRLRLQVLVLSAALASVAGSMYAHWVTVVNPSAASFLLSVEFLLMAVVGGLSSVWGAVLGALFVQALGELLTIWVPRLIEGASGEYQLIGFGVALAAVVVLLPGGLAGVVRRLAGGLESEAATSAAGGHLEPSGGPPANHGGGAVVPPAPASSTGPLLAREGRPAPGTAVLRVTGVSRRFGGVRAVDGVDLVVATGEVVALIGPNGAGKSTLFDLVSGVTLASAGTVEVAGVRVAGRPHRVAAARAARTFQNLRIFGSMSVLENVMVGRHLRSRAGMVAAAVVLPARAEEAAVEASARGLLDLLGLADVADHPAGELPFGRQRLVEIARALATEPDLLLLDEPMAGLSAAERAGLVGLLRRLRDGGMAILLVEHDVDAVMALADRVVVLDEGRVIAQGAPAQIRHDPAVISAYLGDEIEPGPPGQPPLASRNAP
jgi:branched-chain amino acid transport system permease protein